MGVRQSKRSVDITETSTKGEIEGFGNEGKVEKIVDGVMEKVAVNGHVESDLQNDEEAQQNGLEPLQNGEAATLAVDKVATKEIINEGTAEETANANGQLETNGEVNGEMGEKAAVEEESKKSDEKKEKKKKEKTVKKKFSLRNFSFSKKDKSKPTKEEKSPEKVDEAPAENATTNTVERDESVKLQATTDFSKAEDSPAVVSLPSLTTVNEVVHQAAEEACKSSGIINAVKEISEDLPPPLPVTPPPSEPVDGETTESPVKSPSGIVDALTGKLEEVTSSISNTLTEKLESTEDVLKDAEQIAIETGKQIEEKATNLLKAVEKRAEEGLRTATEKIENTVGIVNKALNFEGKSEEEAEKALTAAQDMVVSAREETSESPATKPEDSAEKNEETGAGESLADVPKDLADEVTEKPTAEAGDQDSLEVAQTLPPPPPPVETTAE